MSMNPERLLQEFNARHFQKQQGRPVQNAPVPLDRLQHEINSFLANVPKIRGVLDIYKSIPDITSNFQLTTFDFQDDKLLCKSAVRLVRLSDGEIAKIGRSTIPMAASGFSYQGIGAIFILAYHLRDPSDDNYVFTEEDTVIETTDIPYKSLSKDIMAIRRTHGSLPPIEDLHEEAKAYSYLAASMLRVFAKSPENYVKDFNHILKSYRKFYGKRIPVSVPIPTNEAMKTLSRLFSNGGICKSALYRILFMSGGTNRSEIMREFLYEKHLEYTGMHLVSIFFMLRGALNCSSELLLSVISTCIPREYERQMNALVKILNLTINEDDKHRRRMWRYGRIFDETFMYPLQTKQCPGFVYILASVLKSLNPEQHAGILNIAQLTNLGPQKRSLCVAAGEMVVKKIRRTL